ncbi:hypothetical protein A3A55_01080 [Candidatus Roizmanbacteria bacterium RIFCSPLOWO2_01_FULL_40_14]|nr:MAG: hypothetical protein A3A55_01080 [Candidatus Roizmanbacteria bacterium RIFCSPLOWO2_01_FULL_40_14]
MAQSNSPAKQFIIKISRGLIRTESQAMLAIIIIFILSMTVSAFLLYQTFVPRTNYDSIPITTTPP